MTEEPQFAPTDEDLDLPEEVIDYGAIHTVAWGWIINGGLDHVADLAPEGIREADLDRIRGEAQRIAPNLAPPRDQFEAALARLRALAE